MAVKREKKTPEKREQQNGAPKQADKRAPRKVSEFPHIRHESYTTVYANFAQCALTPWDISILFGELGEAITGEAAVIDRVAVTLTPQLAKALLGILTANLRGYEAQFGEIQMPRGLVAAKLAEPQPKTEEKQ